MNHVAGLPCPLFPEDKNEFVWIAVLFCAIGEPTEDAKPNQTKNNHSGRTNPPLWPTKDLQADKPPNQANAHAGDGQDHKRENQGIAGNRPNIARDPTNRLGDNAGHIGKNGGNSSGGSCQNSSLPNYICIIRLTSRDTTNKMPKAVKTEIGGVSRNSGSWVRNQLMKVIISCVAAHLPTGTYNKSGAQINQLSSTR